MGCRLLAAVVCWALFGLACEDTSRSERPSLPTSPTPPALATPPALTTPPVIAPPLTFPVIAVGEEVRFRITTDDYSCTRAAGRCRSYSVTAPSDGRLEVTLTSVTGQDSFVATTDLYVVPGGDEWDTGPGPRLSVTIPAKGGTTYEIRMYSSTVPSVELQLRAALR
jgi:hypothetical protein